MKTLVESIQDSLNESRLSLDEIINSLNREADEYKMGNIKYENQGEWLVRYTNGDIDTVNELASVCCNLVVSLLTGDSGDDSDKIGRAKPTINSIVMKVLKHEDMFVHQWKSAMGRDPRFARVDWDIKTLDKNALSPEFQKLAGRKVNNTLMIFLENILTDGFYQTTGKRLLV